MASDDDTLVAPTIAADEPAVLDADAGADGFSLDARYEDGPRLGAGGMGEIRSIFDRRIGRQVAIKITHADRGTLGTERFLREARVQGQLEHPSVVPVYDLGHQADGRPYFTMKVLHGQDLAQILERLASGDGQTQDKFGRRRLLSIFVDVCQAIAYAHEKGVIHRDIKPANVMVGDFGEVYVLDWGIAKLRGDTETSAETTPIVDTDQTPQTQAGSVLGTPGYMAPEQLGAGPVGACADVYALGVLLFELLFFTPLHGEATAVARIATTLEAIDWDARLDAQAHEAPPELVQVCQRATALDPGQRYPSVAALLEDVEAYLEGDRDLALREELADRNVQRARALLDDGERNQALRELGRTLALDPSHAEARRLLRSTLLDMPSEAPPPVQERLRANALEERRQQGRASGLAYLLWVVALLPMLWTGTGEPLWVAILLGLLAIQSVMGFLVMRSPSATWFWCGLVVQLLLFIGFSQFFGPLVMTPVLVCTVSTGALLGPCSRAETAAVIGVALSAILVPWGLEHLGVLAASYSFGDQTITVIPKLISLSGWISELFLLAVCTGLVINASVIAVRVRNLLQSMTRESHIRAWQLEQIVPAQTP